MKSKTIIEMDYQEFDDLASVTYGCPMECVALMEWNNDECHSFTVDGAPEDGFQEILDSIARSGNFPVWSVGTVLNDMCAREVIAPGEYVIKVCW